MLRGIMSGFLSLGLLLAGGVWAQEAVVQWNFETDTGSWQAANPAGSVTVIQDPAVVRVEGEKVAEYTYEVAEGMIGGLVTQISSDMAKAKSVRLWMRTSTPTMLLLSLTEQDGSSYMAGFTSLPNVWQDIAMDFSDFALGDDSEDENGLLDPGQINGLAILDVNSFLLEMAKQVPFLVPPKLGERKLWVDDIAFDTEGVLPRWETTEVNGLKGVRLESFESLPLQWLMISAEALTVAYDDQVHSHGNLALRLAYDLPAGKLMGLLTTPGTAPIGKALRLRLSMRSEASTTLLIGLKEEDGSQYNMLLPLTAGEEMQVMDLPLAEFKLADDSSDEDGKFSPAELKELQITDAAGLMGQNSAKNTLWLDDLLFLD